MLNKFVLTIICLFFVTYISAQLSIDLQYRPRAEFRNGFGTLIEQSQKPAFFVQHRGRMTLTYKNDLIEVKTSGQDVRVWGSTPILGTSNTLSIHELYAQLKLSPNWFIKLGSQELVYDNHRMLGNVDWAQPALAHDAVLLKYEGEKLSSHLGLTYNLSGVTNIAIPYQVAKNYKTFQYLWLNYKFSQPFKASFLFLNNGMQAINTTQDSFETHYSQTIGTFMKWQEEKWGAEGSAYYQFGETQLWRSNDINAYQLAIEAFFKPNNAFKLGLGYEILSGNESGSNVTRAFSPFYGTNHKFNGLMDYYFVGNHANSVGLQDIYANLAFSKGKSNTALTWHRFNTANGEGFKDGNLGMEVDVTFQAPVHKYANLLFGYSQYFKTDRLQTLKGSTNPSNFNGWAWAMLDIKLEVFNSKPSNEK